MIVAGIKPYIFNKSTQHKPSFGAYWDSNITKMVIEADKCKDKDIQNQRISLLKKIFASKEMFVDENGKMNLNINQVGGSILSISQFTLYANTNEGNRPAFIDAMKPDLANDLYHKFNDELRNFGLHVEEGIFGAHMEIKLLNDGPVTINLEF